MAIQNQTKHDSGSNISAVLMSLLFILLMPGLVGSSLSLSAQDIEAPLYTCPTDRQVLGFLREAEGEDVCLEEEGEAHSTLTARFERYHLVVVNEPADGNLRLSVEFENRSPISREMLDRANAWNRDRRYSEVYLNESENWVIESDFDCTSGVTEANIIAVIEKFLTVTEGFDHFLNEL